MRFLLLLLLLPLANPAHAESEIGSLFQSAIEHGGFASACEARPKGCPIPAVVIGSISIEGLDSANIAGSFDYRQPMIVRVSELHPSPLGSPLWKATILHEFVHYLQWLTGSIGSTSQCREHQAAEIAAYQAASRYLATEGIEETFGFQIFLHSMACSE